MGGSGVEGVCLRMSSALITVHGGSGYSLNIIHIASTCL